MIIRYGRAYYYYYYYYYSSENMIIAAEMAAVRRRVERSRLACDSMKLSKDFGISTFHASFREEASFHAVSIGSFTRIQMWWSSLLRDYPWHGMSYVAPWIAQNKIQRWVHSWIQSERINRRLPNLLRCFSVNGICLIQESKTSWLEQLQNNM